MSILQCSRRTVAVLTASEDYAAKLWSCESGECLKTFLGHGQAVCSAVSSPDGLRVLTASDDVTAKLWSTASGVCLKTLQGLGRSPRVFGRRAAHGLTLRLQGLTLCPVLLLWLSRVLPCAHIQGFTLRPYPGSYPVLVDDRYQGLTLR